MHRPYARPVKIALAVTALACLTLAGCGRESDDAFGKRVHAYLVAHPEALKDAQEAYYEKQEATKIALAKPLIHKHASEIFADPRDPFVGPKNAKVTVVQFFDYRCPHCKAEAAPGVLAMIKKHPDVKFVFKEFPIFGGPSQAAARTAIGVWQTDPQAYLKVYAGMMNDQDLDEGVNDPAGVAHMKESIQAVVKANGVDVAKVDAAGASSAVDAQMADVQKLAAELGIDGTPGFVVGDTLVSGADMDKVEKLITAQQKG
jgi:protein-disulfide isomerase